MQPPVVTHPHWTELVRSLWQPFAVLAGLAIAGVLLGLKNLFATKEQHKEHHSRLVVVETFVTEQRTASGILPTRQDLGVQIARQADKLTEVKEELTDTLADQGARISGVEAKLDGVSNQLATTNTYLHTIIQQGMGK